MKYHRLHVSFEESFETYDGITCIMGVQPSTHKPQWFSSPVPGLWTYEVISEDEGPYFDFINVFLDMLEPNYAVLEKCGISRQDISFNLTYIYDKQCSLGFDASEMKRLGESRIGLAIDCFENKE